MRTLPSFAPYELRRTYRGPCQDSPAPSSPCIVPRRQKVLPFRADGGNLATAAYVKDHVPRIAFLETGRIIALPIPESNRKSENSNSGRFALYRLPMGRAGQVRRVRHVRQWILGIGSISSYSTNDKAILYASHKPIQSLKMSHESHMSHKSHRQMVKCEDHNPPPESNLKTSFFP